MNYHSVTLIVPPGPIGPNSNQKVEWPEAVRLPAVGDMIHYTSAEGLLATGTVKQVVLWMVRGKSVSGDDLDRLAECHVHLG